MFRIKLKFIVILLCIIGISACGSQKKCNGKRGSSTEMGTM